LAPAARWVGAGLPSLNGKWYEHPVVSLPAVRKGLYVPDCGDDHH